jgi:hypothetical protein
LVDPRSERGGEVTASGIGKPRRMGYGIPKEQGWSMAAARLARAIDLAYMMGYRDIHILGMDGCVSVDGRIAVTARCTRRDPRQAGDLLREWPRFRRAGLARKAVEDFQP